MKNEDKIDFSSLKAVYVNCTLKRSPETSHTQGLMEVSSGIMNREKVQVKHIRLVDHKVASGVFPDMREQGWDEDDWPALFETILQADILVIGTPIWLGEKSSIAQLLVERMYSMSGKNKIKISGIMPIKERKIENTGFKINYKFNVVALGKSIYDDLYYIKDNVKTWYFYDNRGIILYMGYFKGNSYNKRKST